MPDHLKKAAIWLGLASDSSFDSYPVDENEVTEEVDSTTVPASVTDLGTRRPAAASPARQVADLSRIVTVHPRTYNEARTIGEHFREGVPVIMNLSDMDDADAKRLVDFSAGLIFGLRGSIERVTNKVFLLSPANVSVTAEDKQRIAGGFYNQS
jgi:cell division inhibitor SepF